MYEQAKSCVRVDKCKSQYIPFNVGVRQRENLSSSIFVRRFYQKMKRIAVVLSAATYVIVLITSSHSYRARCRSLRFCKTIT